MGWDDDKNEDWKRAKTNYQGYDVNVWGYDKNGIFRGTDQEDPSKKNQTNYSFPQGSGSGSGLGIFGLIGSLILISIISAFLKDAKVYIISVASVIVFFTALFLLLRRFRAKKVIQAVAAVLGTASLVITIAFLGRYSKLRVYPVRFEYSVVQELTNGTAPQLYQFTSMYKNRKPMGNLIPGQRVTILGNTKRGQNFKIQTTDGKVGYIDPVALLPDISPNVQSIISSVFNDDRSLTKLKRTALPINNAMGQKHGQITRIDYGDGYTTLVIINAGIKGAFTNDNIIRPGQENAYHVYDRETGRIYRLTDNGPFYNGVYLVFEPFSSRNFDLIGGRRENDDWNFLDVRVLEQ